MQKLLSLLAALGLLLIQSCSKTDDPAAGDDPSAGNPSAHRIKSVAGDINGTPIAPYDYVYNSGKELDSMYVRTPPVDSHWVKRVPTAAGFDFAKVSYTLDQQGRVASAISQTYQSRYELFYDSEGRLIRMETFVLSNGKMVEVHYFKWDDNGNLSSRSLTGIATFAGPERKIRDSMVNVYEGHNAQNVNTISQRNFGFDYFGTANVYVPYLSPNVFSGKLLPSKESYLKYYFFTPKANSAEFDSVATLDVHNYEYTRDGKNRITSFRYFNGSTPYTSLFTYYD